MVDKEHTKIMTSKKYIFSFLMVVFFFFDRQRRRTNGRTEVLLSNIVWTLKPAKRQIVSSEKAVSDSLATFPAT